MTTVFFVALIGCAKHSYKKMEPPLPAEIFAAYEAASTSEKSKTLELDNVHMTGSMQMPMMDTSLVLDSWIIRDKGLITTYDIPNMGTGGQGYNMEYAWALDPVKGDRLLEGAERESVLQEYESIFIEKMEDLYAEPKVIGWKEIDEQEVWEVQAISTLSDKPITLFFSIETKLLVAEYRQIPMGKGSLNAKMYYKEYTSIDGDMMPTQIEVKTMGLTQVINFDLIEFNVEQPPEIVVPESIRAFIGEDSEDPVETVVPEPEPPQESTPEAEQ